MNRFTTLFSMISLSFSATVALAAPPDYYWHNTEGFKSAASCQVASVTGIPFLISEGADKSPLATENLRTLSGAKKALLLNRSLVRTSKATAKSGYTSIDVVGISLTPKAKTDKSFAKRLDDGYIVDSSLKKLDNYVIELKDAPVKEISNLKIAASGSFWQLATENNQAQVFRCNIGGTMVDHMIFDVYTADQELPVARVGVQADHSVIFRSIVTYTTDEADKVLDARMTHPQAQQNQSLANAVNSSVAAALPAALDPLVVATEAAKKQQAQVALATSNSEANKATTTAGPAGNEQTSKSASDEAGTDDEEEDDSLKLINSAQEHVVCINEDTLSVRNENLDEVLFRAEKNETVLPVQSWSGTDTKKKMINGKEYTFVKVQFPEREGQNIGWLAQDYVRLEGLCPVSKTSNEDVPATAPVQSKGPIAGIDSGACCTFPTIQRPTDSYLTGMRRFKAGRSRGRRLHAACDLYRKHGEATVSLADGKVVKGLYSFYQGTYAMEVQYPGGFIARYGELTGKVPKNAGTGDKVKRGQTLGYIGTVNSNCCKPMLHFEIYSGKGKGSLSTRGNKYQRRSDLIDPTKYLRKWEKNQFGNSY